MCGHSLRSSLRRAAIAALALAAAVVVTGAAPAGKELSSRKFHEAIGHCRSGDEALRTGELSRASEQFEKALAIVPEFPEAYMGLGHIAMVRGDYAAALGSYTRARDAYATISQELLDYRLQKKGQSQLEIRSRRDDIENLTKILKGGPELEKRVRDIEREIDYFDRMEPPRADKRTEAPATVYFFLGNAEFHLDKLEEAVADWEEAARRAPDFGPVFNNLALAYWKLGNKDKSRECLARAETLGVTVHPDFKKLVAQP
jgi:tetratricopeptide (TPR) repeat protein